MQPIVIAGGGPVGLALALILARAGVPSCVLEARDAPTPRDESRAITWMPRGLDVLDWLGLTAVFERQGVRRTAHEFWGDGRRLVTLRFDQLDHPHPYTLQLPQHDTEALLEAAARATGLVDVRRGHRVVAATTAGDHATIGVIGPHGSYELAAPWAIGCDGARSAVRSLLGIPQRWHDYGTDSAVADFAMDCDVPTEVSRITLDPARPYGFFCFAPGRWRFIYRLNRGEDRQAMTSERAATALLHAYLPSARVERFLWASAFRLGQGQCSRYGRGRWLLAGDAAHPMGPSAGAGMMVGLLGAWRLGVRLARTVRGELQGAAVLAGYEDEQRAGSLAVQASNALIFRNLAVCNSAVAAARGLVLRGVGRVGPLVSRLTATEALLTQDLPDGGEAWSVGENGA